MWARCWLWVCTVAVGSNFVGDVIRDRAKRTETAYFEVRKRVQRQVLGFEVEDSEIHSLPPDRHQVVKANYETVTRPWRHSLFITVCVYVRVCACV